SQRTDRPLLPVLATVHHRTCPHRTSLAAHSKRAASLHVPARRLTFLARRQNFKPISTRKVLSQKVHGALAIDPRVLPPRRRSPRRCLAQLPRRYGWWRR